MHDHEWNTKCLDSGGNAYPWTIDELLHKCRDAYRLRYEKPYGYLLLEEPGKKEVVEEPRDAPTAQLSDGARQMAAAVREIEQREIEAYWWDFGIEEQEVEAPGKRDWPLTDTGNAERMVRQHGEKIRFVSHWNKWLAWDGKRWGRDHTGAVHRLAKKTILSLYAKGL